MQIERRSGLTADVFSREHLRGDGVPVVVTDVLETWPARSKWTFEYLKGAYGADIVCPELGLKSGVGMITKLATYIDYLDTPACELAGLWVNVALGVPLRTAPAVAAVPYLVDWQAFQKHPELFEDVSRRLSFVDDWTLSLSAALQERFERAARRTYWEVLVGPAGAVSALHRDFQHTHACLSQLQGRKRAILFAPADSPYLYGGDVDPAQPDLDRFPEFARATAYETILGRGDMLFMPSDWWHHVCALEKSITVSHNFFNATNVSRHLEGLLQDWRSGCDETSER